MKKSVLLVVLVAATAFAGERYLGIINVRGGTSNNLGVAGADAGFNIPSRAKITVQCNNLDAGSANAFVGVDVAAIDAGRGVRITGNQALPTSVGACATANIDGGMWCVISVFSTDALDDCTVWERSGNEF